MSEKFYAERDIIGMDSKGGHYCRHISAMTREDLHSKSDIAAELGFRDMVIAELEAKCSALAAEVQAVRWACGQVYMRGYNHGHLNTVDGLDYASDSELVERGGETLADFTDPDHCGVAADAILAEVRAQGVEMVIAYHRERADALHHVDRNNAIRHSMAALDASDVAAQLRQDANSAELVSAGIITKVGG